MRRESSGVLFCPIDEVSWDVEFFYHGHKKKALESQ
jgi:hypothetical protein